MVSIKNINMKPKLIGTYLIVGLLPALLIGFIVSFQAKNALMDTAFSQLEAVRQINENQISGYFDERMRDLDALASSPYTKMALMELGQAGRGARQRGYRDGDILNDAEYRAVHDVYHPFFQHYLETYGYYDIFLIGLDEGTIYYTVVKEPDFGTDMSAQIHHLSRAWAIATRSSDATMTDMEQYGPSNAPAMFIARPILDEGRAVGVLAMQLPNDQINFIMGERSGMGQTGESYLVGSDNLMRSDSYMDPQGHSVEASLAGTEDHGYVQR